MEETKFRINFASVRLCKMLAMALSPAHAMYEPVVEQDLGPT